MAGSAQAAAWYVDSSVASSGNGQSWGTAWKNLSNISGVSAGDTVYISGGPSGSTRTYSASSWAIPTGSAGRPITYQIGQDATHNGTAIFSCSGLFFAVSPNNVVFSGQCTADSQMHFQLSGCGQVFPNWAAGVKGFRFSYVNMGSVNPGAMAEVFGFGETGGPIELDHLWCNVTGSADCFFIMANCTASSWDAVYMHDNTIFIPYDSSGGNNHALGADGYEWAGYGITISNCVIIGTPNPTYWAGGGSQHQDAIQNLGGGYNKVCNNYIAFTGNAGIYFSIAQNGAGLTDNLIYNNIVQNTFSHACYFVIESARPVNTIANNVVANNLIIDCINSYTGVGLYFGDSGGAGSYSGNIVVNNIAVNSPGTVITSGSALDYANVFLSDAQAQASFVNYIPVLNYDPTKTNSNFHPTASASTLRNQGANESAYFRTDKDGNVRPSSGAWDIGPYQYGAGSSTNPVILVSPGNLNFGSVASNLTVTKSFLVQNVGGGMLAGTATASAPFRVAAGGSYSLGANQSQLVQISYSPSGSARDSGTVTFSSGGGYQASVSGSLMVVLPGLSFASYAGSITAPFATNGGYVSQLVHTGLADGGRAVYAFATTNAGNYTVSASVNAPDTSANSFYINIDSEPTDPTMIWDASVTSGFMNQTVSWRGTGTDTANQFVPAVFPLSAGTHQLIVIGREPGAQLGQITISVYSGSLPGPPLPPQGLHFVVNP